MTESDSTRCGTPERDADLDSPAPKKPGESVRKAKESFYSNIGEIDTTDRDAIIERYYDRRSHRNVKNGAVCYVPVTFPNRNKVQRADLTGVLRIRAREVKRSAGKFNLEVAFINPVTDGWVRVRAGMHQYYNSAGEWWIDKAYVVGLVDVDGKIDWRSYLEHKDELTLKDDMKLPVIEFVVNNSFIDPKFSPYLRGYRSLAEEVIWTKLMSQDPSVTAFLRFFPDKLFPPGQPPVRAWHRQLIVNTVDRKFIEPKKHPANTNIPRYTIAVDDGPSSRDADDRQEKRATDEEASGSADVTPQIETDKKWVVVTKRKRDDDVSEVSDHTERVSSIAKTTLSTTSSQNTPKIRKVNGVVVTSAEG